jgi:serine/threonine-protein kinase
MADVYLGVAQGGMGFNRLVVVKKLREGHVQDNAFVNMFLDEGRLAARLNHPNVIHTYEIGEYEGTYFLAMEYLDGQSVSAISKALDPATPVPPALWVKVISDALAGLHYAHELKDYDGTPLKVIHRDVSPQNLFITYDGRVKLVDFGIAKAALNSSQTETGVLKGKIAYMAPEQAMGQEIDRRADVFPMGVVLWELLAGKRLITGDAAGALHKLLNEPIRPIADVVPGLDADLDAIVMKALQKSPAERYQSAAEMRTALEGWLRAQGSRIDEAQVGAFVSDLFKAKRAEVEKQIQAHISDASADVGAINTLMFTSGTLPSLSSGARTRTLTGSTGRARIPDESDVSAVKPAVDGKGKRGLLTVAAAAVLVTLGVGLGTMRGSHTQATTPVPTVESKVSLTVVAAPPQAVLYLDDQALPGNPYVGKFARDERPHVLRVEAPGFAPSTRTIRLDGNATHEFALVAVVPPAPPPPAAAPEKTKAPAAPRPAGKGEGKKTPTLPALEQEPWK